LPLHRLISGFVSQGPYRGPHCIKYSSLRYLFSICSWFTVTLTSDYNIQPETTIQLSIPWAWSAEVALSEPRLLVVVEHSLGDLQHKPVCGICKTIVAKPCAKCTQPATDSDNLADSTTKKKPMCLALFSKCGAFDITRYTYGCVLIFRSRFAVGSPS
jgi:hypothetical protein